jgi:ribonucleoside-diphosphate reductase alpha chain
MGLLVRRASSHFWDGADLRQRIQFARIGLDLSVSNDGIEQELRCSIHK